MNLIITVAGLSLLLGLAIGGIFRWRKIRGGIVLTIVSLVSLVLGLGLVNYSASDIDDSLQMRSWPTTEGAISDTTMVGERAVLPLIEYSYQVAGVTYIDSTDLGIPGFGSRRYRTQTASKILAEYPPGKIVTVRYNPENPAESLLRPGLRWAPLMRFAVGALLIMTFGALAPIARWRRPRA